MCLAKIGSLQMDSCHLASFYCCELPLISSKSAIQTSERQVSQIHLEQVCPTQIKSQTFPLMLVCPIYRATPIFMICQQPLDIGTCQLDILERVYSLTNIGYDCEAFGKKLLTLGVYFWLGSPVILLVIRLLLHICT